jgi:hypothetical protein
VTPARPPDDLNPDGPPPAPRPALACHVLRGGRSLPCLGVANLSPLGAAVLLGAPARPGEACQAECLP